MIISKLSLSQERGLVIFEKSIRTIFNKVVPLMVKTYPRKNTTLNGCGSLQFIFLVIENSTPL